MPTIYIDDKPYEVKPGQNLLHAVLSLGMDLPYFCWHPALGSVGACRQCAVKQFKDEDDKQGKIVMACMTPATDGTRISIKDLEAHQFRENVIEWLMVNHPHDCPVCDEGGECHLQDMTVMSGHNYREFRFKKRTHRNQNLGPFINHEMNRCISCYRCVRFYKDYAGGDDLDAFAAHDHLYFGRHEDGTLESEFSGNLVEVCPTGVFTDKTLKRHYTRKWDLQTAPSICHQCGLGCNIIPGERYGTLRRILNRYNHHVNDYFLCDRGRFGYEYVNSDQRILSARSTSGEVSKDEAIEAAKSMLGDKNKVIGIGSPRASLESNFALKSMVGSNRFYSGMSSTEDKLVAQIIDILQNGPSASASMKDVRESDAVLVLGEDLTNTAPMLDLAVRQASRNQPMSASDKLRIPRWQDAAVRELLQHETGPVFIATPSKTKLDAVAADTFRGTPADIARLGFAVAHELNGDSPAVANLSKEVQALAKTIAKALQAAEKPMIISGTSLQDKSLIQAAANIAWTLDPENHPANLCYTVPEANSIGAGLLGGHNFIKALKAAKSGEVETVVILENDLYRRGDAAEIAEFFDHIKNVIVIDHLENATTARADIVFPAGTFAESDGTLISNEGRAQRFFQVYVMENDVQEGWRWVRDITTDTSTGASDWHSLDDIENAMFKSMPGLEAAINVAPDAQYRIHGQKIPRESFRYSGRTAMKANVNIHEQKPPEDPDTPMSFSMEGYSGQQPAGLTNYFWSPGWNSVQSTSKYQSEVGGELRGGDPGIRVLEPSTRNNFSFFSDVPEAFSGKTGEWFAVPLYHIFGSDETSVHAEGLSQRIPDTYVALNDSGAKNIQGKNGQVLSLKIGEQEYKLTLRIDDSLPEGVVGLPSGLPELTGFMLPCWTKITGVSES